MQEPEAPLLGDEAGLAKVTVFSIFSAQFESITALLKDQADEDQAIQAETEPY